MKLIRCVLVTLTAACFAQEQKPEAVTPKSTDHVAPANRSTAPLPELYRLKIKDIERDAEPIQQASRTLLESALAPLRQRMEIVKFQACIEVQFPVDDCEISKDLKSVVLKSRAKPEIRNTPAP